MHFLLLKNGNSSLSYQQYVVDTSALLQNQITGSNYKKKRRNPTDPFTILEPQNPSIYKVYKVQNYPTTDFEVVKL